MAKLTDEQVLELKTLYFRDKWTQAALSRKYGIGSAQVGKIVRGEARQGVKSLAELEVDQMVSATKVKNLMTELKQLMEVSTPASEPEFLQPKGKIPYPTKD